MPCKYTCNLKMLVNLQRCLTIRTIISHLSQYFHCFWSLAWTYLKLMSIPSSPFLETLIYFVVFIPALSFNFVEMESYAIFCMWLLLYGMILLTFFHVIIGIFLFPLLHNNISFYSYILCAKHSLVDIYWIVNL